MALVGWSSKRRRFCRHMAAPVLHCPVHEFEPVPERARKCPKKDCNEKILAYCKQGDPPCGTRWKKKNCTPEVFKRHIKQRHLPKAKAPVAPPAAAPVTPQWDEFVDENAWLAFLASIGPPSPAPNPEQALDMVQLRITIAQRMYWRTRGEMTGDALDLKDAYTFILPMLTPLVDRLVESFQGRDPITEETLDLARDTAVVVFASLIEPGDDLTDKTQFDNLFRSMVILLSYTTLETLERLHPHIKAKNVNLKGFMQVWPRVHRKLNQKYAAKRQDDKLSCIEDLPLALLVETHTLPKEKAVSLVTEAMAVMRLNDTAHNSTTSPSILSLLL